MTLDLPPASDKVSARSSVTMAICQVRFEQQTNIGAGATALAFREKLGGADGPYAKVEEAEGAHRLVMGLGPGAPISETTRMNGWNLATVDEAWSLALLPNNMGLQTNRYAGWDGFCSRLKSALDALADVVSPSFEQRLGLRFVDRIQGANLKVQSPQGWKPYVTPQFLGPVLVPGLGAAVQAAQQQLLIDAGDDTTCNLKHGPTPPNEDGSYDYLIDCDLYREGGRSFDAGAIVSVVNTFRAKADSLFQAAVTPVLLDRLEP